MSIDVVYQGLPIAKEARVHFEEGGLFVEVEAPMPVATQLLLSHSDKTPTSTFVGRVRRIREGAAAATNPGPAAAIPATPGPAAGMLIVPADAEKLPRWLMALHPSTAGAAEFQPEAPPEPPPVAATPEPATATPEQATATPEQATAPSATSPEPTAESAPSTRTPESEGDEKKHATTTAKKKKPKRR